MWKVESRFQTNGHDVTQAYNSLLARLDLGFFRKNLVSESIEACKKNQAFLGQGKKMVVVGVGGSSLGTKALVEALSLNSEGKIHFLDNVDSHSVDQWLKSIMDPENWLWYICSKSGGTIEVLSLLDYCHQYFIEKHGFDILNQMAVATEIKESLLFNLAEEKNLPCLEVPKDVGGRFSALTPVGLFPLFFLGTDLAKIEEAFQESLNNSQETLALTEGLWQSHQNQEANFYSFQYCDRLDCFGRWLQQLWSESLSKKVTRTGGGASQVATFVPCKGASDQHSVLQQIMEGAEKKLVCFHQVESSEAGSISIEKSLFPDSLMEGKKLGTLLKVEAEATEQAIRESQSSTIVLATKELDEKSMTHLMMNWMLAVGSLGELLDIDAFNQPGVESGKIITRRVLSQLN